LTAEPRFGRVLGSACGAFHIVPLFASSLAPAYVEVKNSDRSSSFIRAPLTPKIIPGHGPLSGKDALQKQGLYLEELRKEVGAAMAKGLSLEEAQKAVTMEAYKDLRWSNLHNPDIIAVYQEIMAEKNK
jgi:glyoxylase-like metal-dependent hydrolase (beta-lactamase superfamily II)